MQIDVLMKWLMSMTMAAGLFGCATPAPSWLTPETPTFELGLVSLRAKAIGNGEQMLCLRLRGPGDQQQDWQKRTDDNRPAQMALLLRELDTSDLDAAPVEIHGWRAQPCDDSFTEPTARLTNSDDPNATMIYGYPVAVPRAVNEQAVDIARPVPCGGLEHNTFYLRRGGDGLMSVYLLQYGQRYALSRSR